MLIFILQKNEDTRNFLGVVDMLITVVMVSQVYAYALSYQNVLIKCVRFLYTYTSIKQGEVFLWLR